MIQVWDSGFGFGFGIHVPNPDKFDERDPDAMLNSPCSQYFSFNKLNTSLNTLTNRSKSISLFLCNIRSLPKNLCLLEDFICSLDVKPDILAVSETKLNSKTVINIDIPRYQFFHTDSETAAGGAGLYVSNNLHALCRPDIKFKMPLVESCWCEIIIGKNKSNIIVGCIYKHPTANLSDFTLELEAIIKNISEKNQHIYIMGDINIDFLKNNDHPKTEEYLDMLYSNNLVPLITKPTRITNHTATLIDHIYTNAPIHDTVSGIALVDLSDHLPVFCICNGSVFKMKQKIYFRDYSSFNKELYLADMQAIDWETIYNCANDLHDLTHDCIQSIKEVINKHAPLKTASLSKMKQRAKPWISKGLLTSIKAEQKLYKSNFFSKDPEKVQKYKQYSNLLNQLKTKSKNDYYNQHFQLYQSNLKETWKLIGTLIKRKTKGQPNSPTRLMINNKHYTKPNDVAEQFNHHFINVGPNLATMIDSTDDDSDPLKYISNSPTDSFFFSPIDENYIAYLFSNLDIRKDSLDIPNKLIKYASLELSKPFSYIYNLSIMQGVVPNILKVSRVTPVYKNGLTTDPTNCKPIALLSPFSKILEKIISDQLTSFIEKHEILFHISLASGKDILQSWPS